MLILCVFQLKKMGDSGMLKRSGQLDPQNKEKEGDDDDSSSDDENDMSALSLHSTVGEGPPGLARKGSNLNIDAAEANAIHKVPSSAAGDLIVSEGVQRTPSRTPTGIPITPSRQQSKTLDSAAPETLTYQRSKSDSRSINNAMVAPSPKTNAKLILEDAVREVEPMLPPIRQASRDPNGVSRQPSRQPSKDHQGGGVGRLPSKDAYTGVPAATPKSSRLTPRAEQKLIEEEECKLKRVGSGDRKSSAFGF